MVNAQLFPHYPLPPSKRGVRAFYNALISIYCRTGEPKRAGEKRFILMPDSCALKVDSYTQETRVFGQGAALLEYGHAEKLNEDNFRELINFEPLT